MTAFFILCLGGAAGYALSSFPARRENGASEWSAARTLACPPLAVALVGTLRPFLDFSYMYGLLRAVSNDLWSRYALNWPAFAAMFTAGALSYRSVVPTRLRTVTWGVSLFAFVSYTAAVWRIWTDAAFPGWGGSGGAGRLIEFLPLCAAAALLTLKRFDRTVALRVHYIESSRAALFALMLIGLPAFVGSFGVSRNMPRFYIPLLNTLELRQFLYLAVSAMLLDTIAHDRARKIGFYYVLPFAAFMWLNNVAARSAMIFFGERVSLGYMSEAPYFQGIVAILWGITSLACIFGGKRYGRKPLWFAGAGLFALDILKLLIVDLRNSATVIRIFAFLILGGLFLIVGWAAPLPPSDNGQGGSEKNEA